MNLRAALVLTVSVTCAGCGPGAAGAILVAGPVWQNQTPARDLDAPIRSLGSADARERACAAKALAEVPSAHAISHLVRILADETRLADLQCDGETESKEQFFRSETSPGKMAAIALARTGVAAREPLLAALRAAEWQARLNAALGLGLLGGKGVVDPLVVALRDTAWQVRGRAAWALGMKGDARAIDPLIAALSDSDADVRQQAAWALGMKGDERAVTPLVAALKDASAEVRERAAWALGMRQDRRAVDGLVAALEDGEAPVQAQAAWALGMTRDSRASAALTKAVRGAKGARVRAQAAWALGMIGLSAGE